MISTEDVDQQLVDRILAHACTHGFEVNAYQLADEWKLTHQEMETPLAIYTWQGYFRLLGSGVYILTFRGVDWADARGQVLPEVSVLIAKGIKLLDDEDRMIRTGDIAISGQMKAELGADENLYEVFRALKNVRAA